MAVISQQHPECVPELMAYQAITASVALNTNGRHGSFMTYRLDKKWLARWDSPTPNHISLCFFGQNMTAKNWCSTYLPLPRSHKADLPSPANAYTEKSLCAQNCAFSQSQSHVYRYIIIFFCLGGGVTDVRLISQFLHI